jgi:NAD(P)-dependent dehydrogenase (short-subunit alcohol dehydrogenase family)
MQGKVAIVLGASAEGGTGWVIAETLARAGAKVVVGARSAGPLRQLADRIGGVAVPCDAADGDQIAHFVQSARAQCGPVDIAVNSAGRGFVGSIAGIDPQAIQQSLDLHYIGNVHFLRHVTEAMPDGGAITLVSSAISTQPVANHFAYGCAKAAMDCLVRHAALDYGARGIRVNSILPGPIRTPLVEQLLATPGAEDAFRKQIPLARVATPEEIAEVVLFLSRPGYLTGLNLPTSGGMHLTRTPSAEDLRRG